MVTDKVVMGDQKDVLEGMTKFSGNDGAVVWPMWKDDLMNRVKFELGTVAVRILEGGDAHTCAAGLTRRPGEAKALMGAHERVESTHNRNGIGASRHPYPHSTRTRVASHISFSSASECARGSGLQG